MSKKKARRTLRKRLAGLTPTQVFKQSNIACRHLCDTQAWRQAGTVMLYLAMPQEADPTAAMLDALREDKVVCVPRVEPHSRKLTLVRMERLNAQVKIDPYGIREPVEGEILQPADLDLIIVPGLGFDLEGRRLGRGGGYYDTLLSDPNCTAGRCGFAFHQQMFDPLPVEAHDQPVHELITDQIHKIFKMQTC